VRGLEWGLNDMFRQMVCSHLLFAHAPVSMICFSCLTVTDQVANASRLGRAKITKLLMGNNKAMRRVVMAYHSHWQHKHDNAEGCWSIVTQDDIDDFHVGKKCDLNAPILKHHKGSGSVKTTSDRSNQCEDLQDLLQSPALSRKESKDMNVIASCSSQSTVGMPGTVDFKLVLLLLTISRILSIRTVSCPLQMIKTHLINNRSYSCVAFFRIICPLMWERLWSEKRSLGKKKSLKAVGSSRNSKLSHQWAMRRPTLHWHLLLAMASVVTASCFSMFNVQHACWTKYNCSCVKMDKRTDQINHLLRMHD
jgi:hypothetical protein